jgi:hypothetical protein
MKNYLTNILGAGIVLGTFAAILDSNTFTWVHLASLGLAAVLFLAYSEQWDKLVSSAVQIIKALRDKDA